MYKMYDILINIQENNQFSIGTMIKLFITVFT